MGQKDGGLLLIRFAVNHKAVKRTCSCDATTDEVFTTAAGRNIPREIISREGAPARAYREVISRRQV